MEKCRKGRSRRSRTFEKIAAKARAREHNVYLNVVFVQPQRRVFSWIVFLKRKMKPGIFWTDIKIDNSPFPPRVQDILVLYNPQRDENVIVLVMSYFSSHHKV